jgi:hypothetical protein
MDIEETIKELESLQKDIPLLIFALKLYLLKECSASSIKY